MAQTQTRTEQLADAFKAVAHVNHYMVGITDQQTTPDELEGARQILIDQQNRIADHQHTSAWKELDLAIDLVEHMQG